MRSPLKHIIRQIVAMMLYYSGIAPAMLWLRTRQKTVILTYHHVIPDNHGSMVPLPPGTYVTQKTFERHMQLINRHFKVISLTEFCAPDFQQNHSRCCLITFDDGWRDNLFYALGVLMKFDLPATIFIATRLAEEKVACSIDLIIYWLIRLCSSNKISHQELSGLLKPIFNESIDSAFYENVRAIDQDAIIRITAAFKKIDTLQLEKLCARFTALADRLALDSDALQPEILNWDELKQLQQQGIEIGAHSHHHSNLTLLSEEAMREEAALPQKLIERHLGNRPIAFAYPDGKWNMNVAAHVQQAGYVCAFTNSVGYHRNGFSFSVPRINIHEDIARSNALFACELSGIFQVIKNLKNQLTSRKP